MTPTQTTGLDLSSLLNNTYGSTPITLDPSFWGFGGVHGGLSLALMAGAMLQPAHGRVLRSITAQFRRPLRDPFTIEAVVESSGKAISWLSATIVAKDSIAVAAAAVFSEPGKLEARAVLLPMPSAPPWTECSIFGVPPAFVPFTRHLEIRPVGTARPYAGGHHPELLAWVRLVGDERPPDVLRLIVLFDALAPSYSALLRSPIALPTVSFAVHPVANLVQAKSPWVLLRARTDYTGQDGWNVERLDAWTPEGIHIGSAEQIRVLAQKT